MESLLEDYEIHSQMKRMGKGSISTNDLTIETDARASRIGNMIKNSLIDNRAGNLIGKSLLENDLSYTDIEKQLKKVKKII